MSDVEGIQNIYTDPNASPPLCTFEISRAGLDIRAKLDELGSTNQHIKGWSLAN
ncbi:MAG: hypothetical protein GTO76_08970 [Planctomycetales bacterium]|nr:hypothetical protein [Planctomycetales bacterium]NIN77887.1 hypothetical protein [Planctomycetales bacterium]NIP04948.1 hypothetical protein [Planctomycetales bacterium]